MLARHLRRKSREFQLTIRMERSGRLLIGAASGVGKRAGTGGFPKKGFDARHLFVPEVSHEFRRRMALLTSKRGNPVAREAGSRGDHIGLGTNTPQTVEKLEKGMVAHRILRGTFIVAGPQHG